MLCREGFRFLQGFFCDGGDMNLSGLIGEIER